MIIKLLNYNFNKHDVGFKEITLFGLYIGSVPILEFCLLWFLPGRSVPVQNDLNLSYKLIIDLIKPNQGGNWTFNKKEVKSRVKLIKPFKYSVNITYFKKGIKLSGVINIGKFS